MSIYIYNFILVPVILSNLKICYQFLQLHLFMGNKIIEIQSEVDNYRFRQCAFNSIY